MDGGIFRPVSSRKILSMGVSTLAVRPDMEHFGENHTLLQEGRSAERGYLICLQVIAFDLDQQSVTIRLPDTHPGCLFELVRSFALGKWTARQNQ